jgi:hypothetical protein
MMSLARFAVAALGIAGIVLPTACSSSAPLNADAAADKAGGAAGQGTGAAGTGGGVAGTGGGGAGTGGGAAGTGGGVAGTGGGVAGSSGAGQGGAGGAAACAFTTNYAFRDDGGFRAFSEDSTLTPPRTHTMERLSFGADAKISCSRTVPCTSTNNAVTVPAIEAAIANADVQAALAKPAGMLYGTDPRPVDGTVWFFERGDGKSFYVGGGNAVPAGLRALETLLRTLAGETRAAPECAALRGSI